MLKVSHLAAAQLIQESRGSFVSVTFIKKDGTSSKIRGILRDSPASHKNSPQLVTIERVGSKDKYKVFKSININNVTCVKTRGQTLTLTK